MGIAKRFEWQGNNKDVLIMYDGKAQNIWQKDCYCYSHTKRKNLNYFIGSIFYGMKYDEKLKYIPIVYYTNNKGINIGITKDNIISLFHTRTFPINIFVAKCGAIIFWQLKEFYVTIDMDYIYCPKGIKDFLIKYEICGIYNDNKHDYLIVHNPSTGKNMKFEILCQINLCKKHSVKLKLIPVF